MFQSVYFAFLLDCEPVKETKKESIVVKSCFVKGGMFNQVQKWTKQTDLNATWLTHEIESLKWKHDWTGWRGGKPQVTAVKGCTGFISFGEIINF